MVGETNEITFTNLSISDSGTYRCNIGNEATLKFADKYIAVNRKSFGYHLSYPLQEKCAYSEFFWSVFSRIWTEYGEILRGKIRTRKISNTDTFHVVIASALYVEETENIYRKATNSRVYTFCFNHEQCTSDQKGFTFVNFVSQLLSTINKSIQNENCLLLLGDGLLQ